MTRTPTVLTPRPHQVRGLKALRDGYTRTDRTQMHWFCGTGKTLMGRWLAADMQARTTAVYLPSLGLVAQTIAEWRDSGSGPFEAMVVCSDKTAVDAWRIDDEWWAQQGVRVTTDHGPVTSFLMGRTDLPRVVFSTYHSAPVVATAARRAGVIFDLMVCDESHRLAGSPDERFTAVLDDQRTRARKRLFCTATPVCAPSAEYSMDNVAVFGPVVDRQDLLRSVADGLIVDYQILVLDDTGGANELRDAELVPAALVAAAKQGMTRLITFHSRVDAARVFAREVSGLALPDGRTVHARAVAGTDPTRSRRAALDELAAGDSKALTIVSNARCLNEGINVPAVDGVLFADPRESNTDIVQALGRAVRPAPGKTRGYVVLPVVVPAGSDGGELLESRLAGVYGTLRVLRSLDPRVAADLDAIRTWAESSQRSVEPGPAVGGRPAGQVLKFLSNGVDLAAMTARALDDDADIQSWDEHLDLLREWAVKHGHTAIPGNTMVKGKYLGRWVAAQRRAFATESLLAQRATRLSMIPHWGWTMTAAWWLIDAVAAEHVAVQRGGQLDLTKPDIAGSRLEHRTGRTQAITVGRWSAQQRRAYRDGDLTDWQIQRLQSIPGWSWTCGVPERELRLVDALAEWMDLHHDANVPPDMRWGSQPLGAFITAVRRKAVTGRLILPLREDILAVTPGKGQPGALDWKPGDTRWELHLMALTQYAQRTGGCNIPEHGTETLGGYTFPIYEWSTRQRYNYRHDAEYSRDRAKRLEQVPGWTWERESAARVTVGIGARQHDTRPGYAAGCRCTPCTEANTAYEAEREALRAAGLATTDLVDAGPTRGHLRVLEAQIGKRARPAMQQITGFNKKTIDEIINGQRARIHPEVGEALRALTAARIKAHIADNPSTRDELPAGPTMAMVDSLVRRGFPKAWISAEIGGDGRALQIGRTDTVQRRTADAIAALYTAVGDRVAPRRRGRSAVPSLAEIVAAEQQMALAS